MNSFEKALSRRFREDLENLSEITPGVVVDVYVRGRRKGRVRAGKTYDFYDLASMTKIIFSGSVGVHYFSSHPQELKLPVNRYLPWWKYRTAPADLLTHTAGLEWWLPFYKKLKGPLVPQKRWDQVKKQLAKVKPNRGPKKSIYSDLDLWMIGAFYEAAHEKSLLELWQDVEERLSVKEIFFHPGNRPRYARSRYAPTEDCVWRKKILRGEVHDENSWSMGGVSPHAGLFGSVDGVADWGLKLRKAWRGEFAGFGDVKMLHRFTRRQIPPKLGDWGLGFLKPTKGKASCGKYFSLRSFGHTGFTGTSLWFDPVADVLVVILSNRVHPTRQNTKFATLRPTIHNWVREILD